MPRHEKLFRDPVHDIIAFNLDDAGDALLTRLIDLSPVQRLRRLRQLGLAALTFQGAEHSRFGHSLGSLQLARRMLEELGREMRLDPEMAFACQCAALLHDVGHGPFSHVSEQFFGLRHEERTVEIILGGESAVRRELARFDPALPGRVAAIVRGNPAAGVYARIISGQLDCDRMDYLLRDSLMTGVKYGVFDLQRLMKMIRYDETRERLVLSSKGLMPIEKYLQSRYHMYRQVYFHQAVTAAEAMLVSLLRRAASLALAGRLSDAPEGSPMSRFLLQPNTMPLQDFLVLDDYALLAHISMWRGNADPILGDLSERLFGRRLFKSLDVSHLEDPLDERMERAREVIVKAGLDPEFYLLRVESSDTPYRPYDPQGHDPGGPIYIQDPNTGALRDVEEVSATISAFSHSAYTLTRIVFPEKAGDLDIRREMQEIFSVRAEWK